jgi:5-methylcytosine-specific restriction endonuclease McrA
MKVRCVNCRQYKDKDFCVPFGLGWCCDANCRWEAVEKRRRRSSPPVDARRTPVVHRPNGGIKRTVRERDGRRCRFCGTTRALHTHHIVYRSEHGSNDEQNLITLCLGHHDKVHSNKRHWQPILLELIRIHYQEGLFLMVPDVEQRMLAATG